MSAWGLGGSARMGGSPLQDPLASGGDDIPDLLSVLDGPWLTGGLALIVAAAFLSWWIMRRSSRDVRAAALRPKGRVYRSHRTRRPDAWRRTLARLDRHPPTPIESAVSGPIRIEGTLSAAREHLGGAKGRECVWRNRVGARPGSAVAPDLVILRDATGKCGVEHLSGAQVIAPEEAVSVHVRATSLYLGDRVEIFGEFVPDKVEEEDAPTETVYGTLVANPCLEVRLLHRPSAEDAAPSTETGCSS